MSHRHSQTLPNHPNQHPVFCQLQCSMCSSGERFLVWSTVCVSGVSGVSDVSGVSGVIVWVLQVTLGSWGLNRFPPTAPHSLPPNAAGTCDFCCFLWYLQSYVSENSGFVSRIILKLPSWTWKYDEIWKRLESWSLESLLKRLGKDFGMVSSCPIPPGLHDCVRKFQVHRWHLEEKVARWRAKVIDGPISNVRKMWKNHAIDIHHDSTILNRHEIRIKINKNEWIQTDRIGTSRNHHKSKFHQLWSTFDFWIDFWILWEAFAKPPGCNPTSRSSRRAGSPPGTSPSRRCSSAHVTCREHRIYMESWRIDNSI